MALSALDDKSKRPDDKQLKATLGRSAGIWADLKKSLSIDHGPLAEEWRFSGQKYGWSLQLKRKKRTVLHLVPCRKHFLAAFALGEKAVAATGEANLPEKVRKAIREAPRYAEGRGVRLQVRSKKDAAAIRTLACIKMAH